MCQNILLGRKRCVKHIPFVFVNCYPLICDCQLGVLHAFLIRFERASERAMVLSWKMGLLGGSHR